MCLVQIHTSCILQQAVSFSILDQITPFEVFVNIDIMHWIVQVSLKRMQLIFEPADVTFYYIRLVFLFQMIMSVCTPLVFNCALLMLGRGSCLGPVPVIQCFPVSCHTQVILLSSNLVWCDFLSRRRDDDSEVALLSVTFCSASLIATLNGIAASWGCRVSERSWERGPSPGRWLGSDDDDRSSSSDLSLRPQRGKVNQCKYTPNAGVLEIVRPSSFVSKCYPTTREEMKRTILPFCSFHNLCCYHGLYSGFSGGWRISVFLPKKS